MTADSASHRLAAWLGIAGVLIGLAGASTGMLAMVERARPPALRAAELSYLPRGEYLKVAVLGYRQMVADLIWLRAVQHLGELKQTKEGYLWAYHAVDVLTDLDPTFTFAYQATGTILGVWANLPNESIALLTKGMQHNPNDWHLPFVVGYDYFYELHDVKNAAKYFRVASELPGAPSYLPRLAARMTTEAGDPEAALEFLQRMAQQTADERLREALRTRMHEVTIERDIRFLEEAIARFRAKFRRGPRALEELVTSGLLAELPREPLGGRYELNVSDGSVTSTSRGERLKARRN